MSLDGKNAFVTGAGRGIGKAIALRLARDGANVAVIDRDEATATATAAEIESMGRTSIAIALDVRDARASQSAVERVLDEWKQVFILVNNAGITIAKPVVEFEEDEWRRMFDINLHALIRFSQLFAPHMIEQRAGRIVNIASEAAKTVRPMFTLYAATKMGVLGVTRGLSQELAPHGVTVNAICPGIVDTKMWEELDESISKRLGLKQGETLEQRRRSIPLGRLSVPDDVANLVSFVVSDGAAYITGQSLNVTGGREQH